MFILDKPGSDKPTYIFVKKKLFDGPFKQSTGLKILPAYWLPDSRRAEVTGLDRDTAAENRSINALLSEIDKFVEGRIRDARYNGNRLTGIELADKLAELTGRKKPEKVGTGFYERCRLIIADMKAGVLLTPMGKKYSAGTIKNYNQSLNSIEEYSADITFNAINMDFYRSFVKWCNDKDWSMNYIAQHIKNLIVLMKQGKKRGYHNNTAYLDEDFRVIQEHTDDISLSPAELETIFKKNIPNQIRDIARDWFIIDCYTGLRVSDIQLLSDINLAKDSIIIANEKTDTKVVIPLRPEVKTIIKKWGGFPPKITDQEINRSIKEVCEICEINQTVLYFLTKGGQRRDFYLKKYEMVSCHTARRSFITNLLNAGIPDNQVMHLAGIKKHSTLLRYKKTKPEETAEIVREHPFFK